MSYNFFLITFLCIFTLAPIIDGHKILVIVPLYGKSHSSYMKVFIDELLNRGNEITCITSITIGDPKPQNYTEILIDPPYYRHNLSKSLINAQLFLDSCCLKIELNEINLQ